MKKVPISRGMVALVDNEDYEELIRYNWSAFPMGNTFYAIRSSSKSESIPRRTIFMHTQITGFQQTDHKNRNGLDNQKGNLRLATNRENGQNRTKTNGTSSIYKGVCWHISKLKWISTITVDGKNKYLGYFYNDVEAARAYDMAALKYFGEFAMTNEMLGLL